MLDTAILFIVFNRPEETKITFSEIRKAKPSRLYIAADGPRKDNESDHELCKKTRDVVSEIDWPCEVKTRFLESNLGCKDAIVQAISWMFQYEECGIILEDDVLPHEYFFNYMEKMLNLYMLDNQVHAVLGFNFYGQEITSNNHFLYNGYYPWGWGTWRRVWEHFNVNDININQLQKLKFTRPEFKHVLNSIILNLKLIESGYLNTWDYQFIANIIKSDGRCVAPHANLIKNIGTNGVHSVNNELDFQYGKMNLKLLDITKKNNVDETMNLNLFSEHYHGARMIFVKQLLLNVGLFSISRKIYRFIRTVRTA